MGKEVACDHPGAPAERECVRAARRGVL